MYQKITYYSRISQTLHVPVPAAGGGFTPANLSNLLAWYKADDGVFSDAGITPAINNDPVKQWNDQSGHNYHLTLTVLGDEPTYLTAVLNGLPVIESHKGISTTGLPVPFGTAIASVFFVVKWISAGGSVRLVSIAGAASDDTTTGFCIFDSSLTNVATFGNGGGLSSGTITSSTWNEIGTIFDGTFNTLYINNSGQAPVGCAATFAANIDIGALCTGGNNTNYIVDTQIAEIVITKSALDPTDLTNLNTYFINKWGV